MWLLSLPLQKCSMHSTHIICSVFCVQYPDCTVQYAEHACNSACRLLQNALHVAEILCLALAEVIRTTFCQILGAVTQRCGQIAAGFGRLASELLLRTHSSLTHPLYADPYCSPAYYV